MSENSLLGPGDLVGNAPVAGADLADGRDLADTGDLADGRNLVDGRNLAGADLSLDGNTTESLREFTEAVRRHRGACLTLSRRVLRDHQMAEDAVQEAFLDAWRQASRYDAARSSELGWLLTLTHRRAVDRVRREERHGTVVPPPGDADVEVIDDPPEEQVWRAERARSLRAALPGLTQEQYEVLVLAYFGGYTQREIAGLVGIPLGTVKTRTIAAMRRLAVVLRDAGLDAT